MNAHHLTRLTVTGTTTKGCDNLSISFRMHGKSELNFKVCGEWRLRVRVYVNLVEQSLLQCKV